MKFHMKFAIRAAVLIFLLGTMASAKAQQEEHKQEGKPEQQQGRPAQQQRQAQPAARQQTRMPSRHSNNGKPSPRHASRQGAAQPDHSRQTRKPNPRHASRQGAPSRHSSNAYSKATLVGTAHRRRKHVLRLGTEVIPNMAAFPTNITRPALAANTVST